MAKSAVRWEKRVSCWRIKTQHTTQQAMFTSLGGGGSLVEKRLQLIPSSSQFKQRPVCSFRRQGRRLRLWFVCVCFLCVLSTRNLFSLTIFYVFFMVGFANTQEQCILPLHPQSTLSTPGACNLCWLHCCLPLLTNKLLVEQLLGARWS